jgi:hypothetical protein
MRAHEVLQRIERERSLPSDFYRAAPGGEVHASGTSARRSGGPMAGRSSNAPGALYRAAL